jgi:hypothetical protein
MASLARCIATLVLAAHPGRNNPSLDRWFAIMPTRSTVSQDLNSYARSITSSSLAPNNFGNGSRLGGTHYIGSSAR